MAKMILQAAALFFVFMFSNASIAKAAIDIEDTWELFGVTFEKGSLLPYTGTVTGFQQGHLKNGRKEGTWITFWNNGSKAFVQNYSQGKRVGTIHHYSYEGVLTLEGSYNLEGEKHGRWLWYYEDGNLWQKAEYNKGKKEKWLVFDKDGLPSCNWGFYSQDGKRIPPKDGVWPDNDPKRLC